MSAFTTLKISRKQAIEVIKERVDNASDKELEDMIDRIWKDKLFNCLIVPEGMEGQ